MIFGGKEYKWNDKMFLDKKWFGGKEYKWNDKMFLDKKWFGGESSTNGMIKYSWIKNDLAVESVQMEW